MSARISRHSRRIDSIGNLGWIGLDGFSETGFVIAEYFAVALVKSYGDLRSSEQHSGRTVQPHHEYR